MSDYDHLSSTSVYFIDDLLEDILNLCIITPQSAGFPPQSPLFSFYYLNIDNIQSIEPRQLSIQLNINILSSEQSCIILRTGSPRQNH